MPSAKWANLTSLVLMSCKAAPHKFHCIATSLSRKRKLHLITIGWRSKSTYDRQILSFIISAFYYSNLCLRTSAKDAHPVLFFAVFPISLVCEANISSASISSCVSNISKIPQGIYIDVPCAAGHYIVASSAGPLTTYFCRVRACRPVSPSAAEALSDSTLPRRGALTHTTLLSTCRSKHFALCM